MVTEEWLRANSSAPKSGTGWTRKQLAAIGVGWPPGKWLQKLVGRRITPHQKTEFERHGAARRARIAKRCPEDLEALQELVSLAKVKYRYLLGMKQKKALLAIAKAVKIPMPDTPAEKCEMIRLFLGMEFDVTVAPPPLTRQKSRKRGGGKKFSKQKRRPSSDSFYDSREWLELRYKAIKNHGRKCLACGTTTGQMHVDHIKPRSKYPALQLELSNLQVLCHDCNMGKGAWDETDWRD